MRDNSVGDIDGEIVGRIAGAALRHENQVPGTIVAGARMRGGSEGDKTDPYHRISEKLFHHWLQSFVVDPRRARAIFFDARLIRFTGTV